jgi:hypothetical protein
VDERLDGAAHGLHLDASDLAVELRGPLLKAGGGSSIDRTISSFEDFSPKGTAAIEPGNPTRSLLYHAPARPNVYPLPAGSRTDDDFPTLVELDTCSCPHLNNHIPNNIRRDGHVGSRALDDSSIRPK